ncbi:MAG: hypothetical protein ACK4GK_17745 [Ferrovibrio sp.]
MSKPWDIPPFPKRGNASQATLFASVGRALMAWEEIETTFAHQYSLLVSGEQFDEAANQKYGKPNTFVERIAALEKAACKLWHKYPNQELEGRFMEILKLAKNYSARRNDIAHAVARFIHWIREPNSTDTLLSPNVDLRWCLVPPHFRGAKFTRRNVPDYVLTSREINVFAEAFWEIARAAAAFSRKIEAQARTLNGKSHPRMIPPPLVSRFPH